MTVVELNWPTTMAELNASASPQKTQSMGKVRANPPQQSKIKQ